MSSTPTAASLVERVRDTVRAVPAISTVDDGGLRDLLVDLEAARNAFEAEQAMVMAEMHRRAEAEEAARDATVAPGVLPLVPAYESQIAEFVSDEIAVLLSCTRMLASHRLETAVGACTHPSLMAIWQDGAIDARKAAVISEGLRDTDPAFADTLAGEAARYATSRTATQTRAWLMRRVLAADPGMAEVRRARASEGRRVIMRPTADGMAELCALLPGVQARQAFDSINALALATTKGDARTSDQRRADALMDLLTGRASPPQVNINVVVPADTLAGDSDRPGWVPGLGPITAGEARKLALTAGQPKVRQLMADPDTGALTNVVDAPVPHSLAPNQLTEPIPSEPQYRPSRGLDRAVRERDMTCRFPGCRRSALGTSSGTDLDHTDPWPKGSTAWGNLAVLCRRHHRLKHSPGWLVELTEGGVMIWTTPTGRRYITEPWQYLEPPDTG